MSKSDRKPARDFTDLIVWRKAHELVLAVYKLTRRFPKEETYGLTSQFRRAAVSVPANIAEGFRRRGSADKLKFMNYSHASLEECRYYMILANDLGYGLVKGVVEMADEVGRLIMGYVKGIEKKR